MVDNALSGTSTPTPVEQSNAAAALPGSSPSAMMGGGGGTLNLLAGQTGASTMAPATSGTTAAPAPVAAPVVSPAAAAAAASSMAPPPAVAPSPVAPAPVPVIVPGAPSSAKPDASTGDLVDSRISQALAPFETRETDADRATNADRTVAARRYVKEISTEPGYTMQRQGDAAIDLLHPVTVERFALAARQAREEGIPVSIRSAYRPPAFGIGGFGDKSKSLHAYGLAFDVSGLDGAGGEKSRRWYEIASEHGLINPYGPNNRKEFNHYQVVPEKSAYQIPGLRDTITAKGPRDVEQMWAASGLQVDADGNVTLNRKMPMTNAEAESTIAKLGFPSVEAYQEARGATVDGIIGPETRSKLVADMSGTGGSWPLNASGVAYADDPRVAEAVAAVENVALRPDVTPEVRDEIMTGSVPWPRLSPRARDDLTAALGADARRAYEKASDTFAAEDRGGVVRGKAVDQPEMWGDVGEPAEDKAKSESVSRETPSPSILKRGSEGPEVASYQMMLAGMGLYQAGIDQDFGRRTEAAVKAFQSANGLKADGKIGPMTGPAIEAAFARKIQRPTEPITVDPRRYEQTGITARERLDQRKIGGPVAPMTEMDKSMSKVLAGRELDRVGAGMTLGRSGDLGTPETAMSLARPQGTLNLLTGNTGPVYGNEAAVNRAGKGDRLPVNMLAGGAGEPAELGQDTSGLIRPVTPEERALEASRPSLSGKEPIGPVAGAEISEEGTKPILTTRFEKMDQEGRIAELQRVIEDNAGADPDTISGVAGDNDIGGGVATDALNAAIDRVKNKGEAGPPGPAPVGDAPETAMERELSTEGGRSKAAALATGIAAGSLRGVEDMVSTVANGLGWTFEQGAKVLESEGILAPGTAERLAESNARRSAFAEGGPMTAAVAGPDAENLPGYGVGRLIGNVAATAGPVGATLRAIGAGARLPIIGRGLNYLAGGGGFGSRTAANALAGGEGAALVGEDPVFGAGLGAGFGLGFGAGSKVVRAAWDKLTGAGVKVASPGALGNIAGIANRTDMDIDAAIASLRKNPDQSLADVGGPAMTDEVSRLGAVGGDKATQVVKGAADDTLATIDRALLDDYDRILGAAPPAKETLANIERVASDMSTPLREAAYARPDLALAPVMKAVDNIDAMIAGTKGKPLQNALTAVKDSLYTRGGSLDTSVRGLHEARKALDDMIQDPPRALGSNAKAVLTKARAEIDGLLKTVPEMAQHDRTFATGARIREAFEEGQNIMKADAEDVIAFMNDPAIPEAQKIAFQTGARTGLAKMAEGSTSGAVVASGRQFRSEANQKKLNAVFGPEGNDVLEATALRADQKAAANEARRNSATGYRQRDQFGRASRVTNMLLGGAAGAAGVAQLGGDLGHMAAGILAGGAIPRAVGAVESRIAQKVAGETAEALTLRGEDAIKVLEAIRGIKPTTAGQKSTYLPGVAGGAGGWPSFKRNYGVNRLTGDPNAMVPTGN